MARFPPSRIALGLLALLSSAPSVGAPPAPDRGEISWPSGIVQSVERPGINRVLHVVKEAP